MTMRRDKTARLYLYRAKQMVRPFWIGMMAGGGFLACVGTTTPVTPVARPIQSATTQVAQSTLRVEPAPPGAKPVFERVEDYGYFPETEAPRENGTIKLLPPTDPMLAEARIRGVQWPMVQNAGPSQVFPRQKGLVSFYWQEQKVATGETYDSKAMTAAHKTLPFGTLVRCTRVDNGRSVVVMINDRGPYVKGRILDVSRSAARELDMIKDGVAPCLIEVLAYPVVETMGPKGNG